MVTLASGSTKELLYKGWGSPHPQHKVIIAAPHQTGGVDDVPTSHQDSKDGKRTKIQLEQLSSTTDKAHNLALTLKLGLA